MTAEYTVHGDVAVITLMNPPVNGLGLSTRIGITEGLEKANNDASIKAIVITGAGKAFSGGADIREFGSPKATQEPNLLSVIGVCENSSKPVVAAIHSVAMGGGLELALGCHYRIAAPGTSIALPEVKLGLIPGAGGTQRLPRVIGVEPALNMIVTGEAIKSEMLAMLPGQKLFDAMAQSAESLPEEALALARKVAAAHADGSPKPLVRNLPCKHPQGDAYFQFTRNMAKGMAKNLPAPLPATPAGILEILRRYKIETTGKHAVVVGNTLVLGGGWSLSGGTNAPVWPDHGLLLDLQHPERGWSRFAQPFQRRALAMAALGNRIGALKIASHGPQNHVIDRAALGLA